MEGKLEARVQSPCVTPGYWRRDDLTSAAFNEDGYLRTGDALQWGDAENQQCGFPYDGRLAEDFKLVTGTWVRVSALREHLLKHLAPELRDVVIAGDNRGFIAVLGIPFTAEIVGDHAARARCKLNWPASLGKKAEALDACCVLHF